VTDLPPPRWPDDPALFLDLDGTLIDFAFDPSQVEVPPRLRGILGKLPEATNGAIAFVSGRTLADLDRLLGHGRFPIAAVHGLQRRDARGRLSATTAGERDLEHIEEIVEQIAAAHPYVFLEHKGVTIALHYRRCPHLEQELIEQVEAKLEEVSSSLRLMRGNMVLEIKPVSENKGTAIAAFMGEVPFTGRTPVFIGDDVTDEDGFRAVNELDGVSVKVDSGSSCARYRLPNTAAVIDWLEDLVTRRPA